MLIYFLINSNHKDVTNEPHKFITQSYTKQRRRKKIITKNKNNKNK